MSEDLLTVKQLADKLGLSVKTIQRAYRRGHIPVKWICRTAFFDLRKVYRAMDHNGKSRVAFLNGAERGAPAGSARRRAPKSPRSVKRGRNFQQSSRRKS